MLRNHMCTDLVSDGFVGLAGINRFINSSPWVTTSSFATPCLQQLSNSDVFKKCFKLGAIDWRILHEKGKKNRLQSVQ